MSTPAGATSLGRYLYLFKSKTNSKDCIISAHGGYISDTKAFRVPDGIELRFFSVHSSSVLDPRIQTFQKNQALAEPVEVFKGGQLCNNYLLTKYQGRHNEMDETYKEVADGVAKQDMLRSGTAGKMFAAARTTGGDNDKLKNALNTLSRNHGGSVLTVRNRIDVVFGIPLEAALKAAMKEMGSLRVFHCLFCRSYMLGKDKHEAMDVKI